MIAIPQNFCNAGFDFRQLERIGQVAVLEKRKSDRNVGFEVVRIRQVPESVMFGRTIKAHESMPSSEQWGLYGWTYSDKATALRKFLELTQECPPLSTQRPKQAHIPTGMCESGLPVEIMVSP